MEPCFFSYLYCEDTQKSIVVAISGHFLLFFFSRKIKATYSDLFRHPIPDKYLNVQCGWELTHWCSGWILMLREGYGVKETCFPQRKQIAERKSAFANPFFWLYLTCTAGRGVGSSALNCPACRQLFFLPCIFCSFCEPPQMEI